MYVADKLDFAAQHINAFFVIKHSTCVQIQTEADDATSLINAKAEAVSFM